MGIIKTTSLAEIKSLDATKIKKVSIDVLIVGTEGQTSGAGKSGGREWQRQVKLVNDPSGSGKIVAWNENIKKLETGKRYTIENADLEYYMGINTIKVNGKATIILVALESSPQTTTTTGPTIKSSSSSSDLEKFVTQQYEDIHTIEATLLDLNDAFGQNGMRLGMYINNINAAWQKKKKSDD